MVLVDDRLAREAPFPVDQQTDLEGRASDIGRDEVLVPRLIRKELGADDTGRGP